MTSRDFCYWLQGFFEIRSAGKETGGLDKGQVDAIQKHLSLVFKHEIDPSYGDDDHQQALNEIHQGVMAPDPLDGHDEECPGRPGWKGICNCGRDLMEKKLKDKFQKPSFDSHDGKLYRC